MFSALCILKSHRVSTLYAHTDLWSWLAAGNSLDLVIKCFPKSISSRAEGRTRSVASAAHQNTSVSHTCVGYEAPWSSALSEQPQPAYLWPYQGSFLLEACDSMEGDAPVLGTWQTHGAKGFLLGTRSLSWFTGFEGPLAPSLKRWPCSTPYLQIFMWNKETRWQGSV